MATDRHPTTLSRVLNELASLRADVQALLRLTTAQAEAPPPKRDPSIRAFCERHGMSTAHYYDMQREGTGPRVTAIGSRRIITEEAEADWIREREAEAARIDADRRATPGWHPQQRRYAATPAE